MAVLSDRGEPDPEKLRTSDKIMLKRLFVADRGADTAAIAAVPAS
jgi:hypothetical protein